MTPPRRRAGTVFVAEAPAADVEAAAIADALDT